MLHCTLLEYKKWRPAFLLCLLTSMGAGAQTIENIRDSFDQSRQLVLIYYDLKGLSYKQEIQILPQFMSGNDSITPSEPALRGDVGWVTNDGKNKLIIWDPFADGITNLRSFQVFIKTNVRKAVLPKYAGLFLHGSNSAPFGIKFMTLGRDGFFLGFRKRKSAPSYQYKVSNEGVINYLESGVYKIGSDRRLASYAVTAGKTFRLSRNTFGLIGVGYGAERLFWKYQAYNFNGVLIDDYWALNENVNRKGLVVDLGTAIRVRNYAVDLGLSTINFNSFQIIASISTSRLSSFSIGSGNAPGKIFYKNK